MAQYRSMVGAYGRVTTKTTELPLLFFEICGEMKCCPRKSSP